MRLLDTISYSNQTKKTGLGVTINFEKAFGASNGDTYIKF